MNRRERRASAKATRAEAAVLSCMADLAKAVGEKAFHEWRIAAGISLPVADDLDAFPFWTDEEWRRSRLNLDKLVSIEIVANRTKHPGLVPTKYQADFAACANLAASDLFIAMTEVFIEACASRVAEIEAA